MAYELTNSVRRMVLDCNQSDRVTGFVRVATKEGDFDIDLNLSIAEGVPNELRGHCVSLRPVGGHVSDKSDWTPVLSAGDGRVSVIRLGPDVHVEWDDYQIGRVIIGMESVAVQA